MDIVNIVGGGLAGSECALQLADRSMRVRLFEQRPSGDAPAHKTALLGELVCSNSLKSTKGESAAGTLKAELDMLGSRLLPMARACAVPAGGALAVDRDAFARMVTEAIEAHPLIELRREQVDDIPDEPCVICAGPLCTEGLFARIGERVGGESLSFFDAAAPIVDAQTIDLSKAFSQSRYEEGGEGDYLNCPFDREAYEAFWNELVGAKRVISHDFESRDLFQACQPVEEIARKGIDALRFGALKPVGLTDPATGRRPWAAVQLRAENAEKTSYNLVGFQTNLIFPEQDRVFRMIPGLEEAEFVRHGVMHRNSFVDSPHCLDPTFAIPGSKVRLAGQITGTEGYVEAIASGLLAALNTWCDAEGLERVSLPRDSVFGALVAYATNPDTVDYQPMHVNFGLMAPLSGKRLGKRERYAAYAARAREALADYLATRLELASPAAGK